MNTGATYGSKENQGWRDWVCFVLRCQKRGREWIERSVSVSLITKCLFRIGEELHAGH